MLAFGLFGEVRAARSHHRWWVVALGVLGSAVLFAGWSLRHRPVLYSGMALLFAASALTFWAKRHPRVPLVQIRLGRKGTNHDTAKG